MTWREAMTELQTRGFQRGVASVLLAEASAFGSTECDGVEIIIAGDDYEIRTVR